MGYSSATGNPPSFSTWAALHITLGRDSESVQTGEDAGVTLKVSKQGFPRSVPKPQGQVCDTLRPSHPKIPFTAIMTRATRASFLDRGRGKVTLLLTFEQIQKAQKHTMAGEGKEGGLPHHRGKESTCNARDSGLTPGSGRSPGGGNGNPLQYPCLENPMDRGAWWATVHEVTKSQT